MSAVLHKAESDAASAAAAVAADAEHGEAAACFHCGSPAPDEDRWQAQVDGNMRRMCCAACAAAVQAIVDAGLADYYATRTAFAARPDARAPQGPEGPAPAQADATGTRGEASFTVAEIRCAAGARLVERHLRGLNGILGVHLDPARDRVHVRWEPSICRPDDILRALREIGYTARPHGPRCQGEHLERAHRRLRRRLFVAGLSTLQLAPSALAYHMAGVHAMDAATAVLMGWVSMLLTMPAVLYAAQPFFAGAWRDLQRRTPGMDVPVALGIAIAFGGSCAAFLQGGDTVFGTVAVFVFLVLGCRYLELGARRQAAGSLARLQQGLPASALRLRGDPLACSRGDDAELVAAASLRVDDLVLVRAGQAVPADGVIHEGETEVDLALLTGESRTRRRAAGDALPGGAVNATQTIVLRVTSTANDSLLSMLVRLGERASRGKPALVLWADRVAALFVLGLLALAVLAYAAWLQVDPGRAWQVAVAVLVVSCPCALSLAMPTALAAATDRLLRRGVLVVQPHMLETFDRATHVVFDKTGTLTWGRPVLRQTLPVGPLAGFECLRIAAALETDNPHPLAQAIRGAVAAPGRADGVRCVVGQGVEGWVDGQHYRLGSAAWVAGVAGGLARAAGPAGTTSIWLGAASGWLARFDLADGLRPDAGEVVDRLRAAGKTVILLSGDEQHAAQAVAAQLGIATVIGGKLPEEKLVYLRRLQRDGAVVAMVGDGINDAPVLGSADVSFAMGRGAELAQLHADAVLMGDALSPLADTLATARRTQAVIRQNLSWATLYNVAAIPAAATGLLAPWVAGVAMAASSALVVLNALRLRRE